jgi:DNA-3-methyladenine glycosylase
MYRHGGVAYVYLCYGIHELFNVVTGLKDNPQAILIRKIIPYRGINIMEQRRNMKIKCTNFSSGPGTTSKALGITRDFNGIVLNGSTIGIANLTFNAPDNLINVTPRIGVEYAGNDALLPYRFVVNNKDLESFLSID